MMMFKHHSGRVRMEAKRQEAQIQKIFVNRAGSRMQKVCRVKQIWRVPMVSGVLVFGRVSVHEEPIPNAKFGIYV